MFDELANKISNEKSVEPTKPKTTAGENDKNTLPFIFPKNYDCWKSKDQVIFGENLHMLKRIYEKYFKL